jgi:hypothetical protein
MSINSPIKAVVNREMEYLTALAESLEDCPMKPLSDRDRARIDGDLYVLLEWNKRMKTMGMDK